MTRVHVFCEGQTEEAFVKDLLRPHFERVEIWLYPIVVKTGPRGRGGVVSYHQIKQQVEIVCKKDHASWVTTMLDFYGLPKDFPSKTNGNSMIRAASIERAFQIDVGQRNFIANILRHEFEGLLFSQPDAFGQWFDDTDIIKDLQAIRNSFASPEHINDNQATAPSKRILKLCNGYQKVSHGALIAIDIGLDTIRRECPHFDTWIKRIEGLKRIGES